jgi:hypothetical protein
MQTAIEQAEEEIGVIAATGRRADQAMREGLVPYDRRVGFARRNLLQLWLTYCAFSRMRPRPEAKVAALRRQLRRAIGVYRRLNIAETRGIDTSVRAA